MKTLLMNTLCYVVLSSFAFAQQTPVTPFITTWQTDNPGTSANDQITIPTTGTGYNYSVAWENVNDTTISGTNGPFTGDTTLTFPQAGTYRVSISGDFPRIFFNLTGDCEKLLTVEQWGSNPWQSMGNAFSGCINLTVPAQDVPDLANVTDMSSMFRDATSFNQPIGNWDVSNVTNMRDTFFRASLFNQDIEAWDVQNVTDMTFMFAEATSFNQPLGNWNVSNVRSIGGMFSRASAFNQDIGAWNVQNVIIMAAMFVEDSVFNQDLGAWNVSNVIDMSGMFFGAAAFNQNLGRWNIKNVFSMRSMLDGTGLSIANYDSTLSSWAALPALRANIQLGAINLQYCNAEAARDTLINTFNWTITDAGRNCGGPAARLASEPNDVTRMAGDQENSWHSIIVYPNPATDQFMTVFTRALAAPARWVLTDHMGQQVARGNLVEGTTRQAISTDGLAPGTYFYRLVVGGNITSTKRIVIAR